MSGLIKWPDSIAPATRRRQSVPVRMPPTSLGFAPLKQRQYAPVRMTPPSLGFAPLKRRQSLVPVRITPTSIGFAPLNPPYSGSTYLRPRT